MVGNDSEFEQALEQVTRAAERYAQRSGMVLQPDTAFRCYVLRGLARNLLQYGRAYCPCREISGDLQKDRADVCPCRTYREEIARSGECECGLFVAANSRSSGRKD